jgi:hypothetical protein
MWLFFCFRSGPGSLNIIGFNWLLQYLKEKEDGAQRLCSKAGTTEAELSCWL